MEVCLVGVIFDSKHHTTFSLIKTLIKLSDRHARTKTYDFNGIIITWFHQHQKQIFIQTQRSDYTGTFPLNCISHGILSSLFSGVSLENYI
jgi:hypothetical protein